MLNWENCYTGGGIYVVYSRELDWKENKVVIGIGPEFYSVDIMENGDFMESLHEDEAEKVLKSFLTEKQIKIINDFHAKDEWPLSDDFDKLIKKLDSASGYCSSCSKKSIDCTCDIDKINDFIQHINSSVSDMLDIMGTTGEVEERFNLILEMNGKKLELDIHAELHHRLEKFLQDEINDLNS